jgi:hypothetical protein
LTIDNGGRCRGRRGCLGADLTVARGDAVGHLGAKATGTIVDFSTVTLTGTDVTPVEIAGRAGATIDNDCRSGNCVSSRIRRSRQSGGGQGGGFGGVRADCGRIGAIFRLGGHEGRHQEEQDRRKLEKLHHRRLAFCVIAVSMSYELWMELVQVRDE